MSSTFLELINRSGDTGDDLPALSQSCGEPCDAEVKLDGGGNKLVTFVSRRFGTEKCLYNAIMGS